MLLKVQKALKIKYEFYILSGGHEGKHLEYLSDADKANPQLMPSDYIYNLEEYFCVSFGINRHLAESF